MRIVASNVWISAASPSTVISFERRTYCTLQQKWAQAMYSSSSRDARGPVIHLFIDDIGYWVHTLRCSPSKALLHRWYPVRSTFRVNMICKTWKMPRGNSNSEPYPDEAYLCYQRGPGIHGWFEDQLCHRIKRLRGPQDPWIAQGFMSNVCAYIYLYLYLHNLFANLSTILYKCFCLTPTLYGGHLRAKPPLTANSAARSKVGLWSR